MSKEEIYNYVSFWIRKNNPKLLKVEYQMDTIIFKRLGDKVVLPNKRISNIFLGDACLVLRFSSGWVLFINKRNGAIEVEPIR